MLPLVETIAETAAAAAFEDPRFDPVSEEEAPHLNIEISVLTVPKAISPDEVVVGRDGLIVGQHGRRGLLLPQVPLQYGWDRETFLAQTCVKAGLPPEAWRHGATIEGFTAEVFGES
jgi:AmmeMemoRadiSam system protein A